MMEEEEESDVEEGSEEDDEDEDIQSVPVGNKRKRESLDDAQENLSVKKPKASDMAVAEGTMERVDKQKKLVRQQAEEKRLGEMMIPKKHKRLYHKIMTSRKKSTQEAKKLQEKKEKIVARKKKQKKSIE
uniref:Uncharacterized protein n=1 Tax=Arion vulgaris TaxID=1028688 RepID=A0A0B7BDW9_9EUPU